MKTGIQDTLKSVSTFILGLCLFLGTAFLAVMVVKGGVWLSVRVYPWLSAVSGLAFITTIFVLLPLALFRRTRALAGLGMYYVSFVFGITLWVCSLLLSWTLWGAGAVIAGFLLMGVGVVPVALLATLCTGLWPTFGALVLLTAITFGTRALGIYFISKAAEAEDDLVQSRRNSENYFLRHWRGELSLGVSYWVSCFLVSMLVAVAFAIAGPISGWVVQDGPSLKLTAVFCILSSIVTVGVTVWQIVGTWRSASNHAARGGKVLWALLAKVALVLGILGSVRDVCNTLAPQAVEHTTILLGDKGIPPYKITVLPGGNEVEFRGGLRAGSAKELVRIVRAVPGAKVLRVNSVGGRLHEAQAMVRLVRERGLTTYTSEECLSAATLVLIAGEERVVAEGAKVGFHRPSFPGLTSEQEYAAGELMRRTMRSAGVAEQFIDHVLATPSEQMWFPTIEELLRSGVVTSESVGERYAVSDRLLRGDSVKSPGELQVSYEQPTDGNRTRGL